MTIVERLQRAIDDEPFMLGGEHDLLRDALNEIEIQRGIIERLRADLATQQGCCDGAAAQDAHVRQEREEHRDEVKRLSAEMDAMRLDKNNVISTWRGRAGRAEIEKDKLSIERAKLLAENERLRAALGWMLALHDDPQPSYDKGSTIAAARRVHGGGR